MDALAPPMTIAVLARTYVDRHSSKHHSGEWQNTVYRHVKNSIIPRFGQLAPEALTPRMVATFVSEIAETGKRVKANHVLIILRTIFAWGFQTGRLDCANPAIGIKRQKTNKNERFLTLDELAIVWRASHGLADFGAIFRMLALTGCRPQEIGSLVWPEVNREARQIELPKQRVKNRRPHVVPLSELALAQLPPRRDRYPNVFGRCRGRGFEGWSKGMSLMRERVAIPPWRLYDLRATFVTHCNELELAPPHIIEAAVNHIGGAKASVAGVYNKAQWLPQRRALMEAWSAQVARIVRG